MGLKNYLQQFFPKNMLNITFFQNRKKKHMIGDGILILQARGYKKRGGTFRAPTH
jgi:hypothetical protein